MAANISLTDFSERCIPLPGEGGYHYRDGSLLAKKREQWQQEKGKT
jgi:Uma2 family endonuclease